MLVSNKPNVHNQDGDRSRHFEVFLSLTALQRPFHDMTSVSGKTKQAIKTQTRAENAHVTGCSMYF